MHQGADAWGWKGKCKGKSLIPDLQGLGSELSQEPGSTCSLCWGHGLGSECEAWNPGLLKARGFRDPFLVIMMMMITMIMIIIMIADTSSVLTIHQALFEGHYK